LRPPRGPRTVFEVLGALLVGGVAWVSAQFSRMRPDLESGPWRHEPEGPGRYGPRSGGYSPDIWWSVLPSVLVIVAAVALRRTWPRVSFIAVVLAVGAYLALGAPYGPVLVAPALAVHAMAAQLPLRRWLPYTALLVPMLMAGFWDQPYLGLLDPTLYGVLVIGVAVAVVPALFGLLHRSRREAERMDRDQELHRYAYEERLRIAQEVHDVVGHSLSVINLQAGVALHVLPKRPDQVESSLEAIRATSKQALSELRSTLDVFRDPAADRPLAPPPGLARLDDLVNALRAAGRTVNLDVDVPAAAAVPDAVDQAAFRITQEALTNAVRHAGSAIVDVTIAAGSAALVLQISDDNPDAPDTVTEGLGLRGMRERARAVGGTLTTFRSPRGGFVVQAELPLQSAGVLP